LPIRIALAVDAATSASGRGCCEPYPVEQDLARLRRHTPPAVRRDVDEIDVNAYDALGDEASSATSSDSCAA
jgi:hypothetical protein